MGIVAKIKFGFVWVFVAYQIYKGNKFSQLGMNFTGRKLQIVFLVFIYPLGIVNQMARTTFILLFSFVIRNEFLQEGNFK